MNQPVRSSRQKERWLRSRGPRLSAASLILIGLILGLIGALYYAWILEPVVFTEASPARLSDRHKGEYILLISQSFQADGNWARTEERLAALNDPDIAQTVGTLLEEYLRQGRAAADMKSLALLARRMDIQNAAVSVFAPEPSPTAAILQTAPVAVRPSPETQATPTATSVPLPTETPTPAPSPTQVPVYRLLRQEQLCNLEEPIRRIEVIAVDPFLEPMPGAEVIVEWDGGRDRFFTGFQPERGMGYGDFLMSEDISYQIMMSDGSQIVSGLEIITCNESEGGLDGGWRLTFQNTDVVQEGP